MPVELRSQLSEDSSDEPHPKKQKKGAANPIGNGASDITNNLKKQFAQAQKCLHDKRDKTDIFMNQSKKVNINKINETFQKLRKMIDESEKMLKTKILMAEKQNKASMEKFLKSINSKEISFVDESEKFEKLVSTGNYARLSQEEIRLKNFLQQFKSEVSSLRPSRKTNYCVDAIDELETRIENVLKQVCITEFASPDANAQLQCGGRRCINCGECRDWYYVGDFNTWNWIQGVREWNEAERKRWDDGNYEQRFKIHDGSTCRARYGYYYDRSKNYHGPHINFSCGYSCRGCGCLAYDSFDEGCCGMGVQCHFNSGVYDYCQCSDNAKISN